MGRFSRLLSDRAKSEGLVDPRCDRQFALAIALPTVFGAARARRSEIDCMRLGRAAHTRPVCRQPARQSGYTFAGRRIAATPRAFSASTAGWRAVLFKVKTRLCNGEPSPSDVRRTRLLESQFGKNLAKMSIVSGLHCRFQAL